MTNLERLIKCLTGERNKTWENTVLRYLNCPYEYDDGRQTCCGGFYTMSEWLCIECMQRWLDAEERYVRIDDE